MQVVVSRRSGALRGIDEGHEAPDVAERTGERRLRDPDDAGSLELFERQLLDLAQQRLDDIRSSELDREPGGSEQAPAAAREVAQLARAPQRRDSNRERTPLPSPRSCLLKLERNGFMLAREQGRTVPSAPGPAERPTRSPAPGEHDAGPSRRHSAPPPNG